MADNVIIPASGTGDSGKSVRTVDKGAKQIQVIQLDMGSGSTETLVSGSNGLPVGGVGNGAFVPDGTGARRPDNINSSNAPLSIDPDGNLNTRSTVLTDEGSMREDFPGSSLAVSLTGSPSFTNGSTAVTGSGTAFLTQLVVGEYIKLDAHAESAWAQIASVNSDTSATLATAYTGATASGASSTAEVKPTTGSGGTISVATSAVTLASGTTISAQTYISREFDFSPIVVTFAGVTISQRIANNDVILGFHSTPTSPIQYARFRFTSTVNTAAIFETAYVHTGTPGANDTETTNITLPNGGTTATSHRYRVEVLQDVIRAYIDDVLVAEHKTHLLSNYTVLNIIAGHINGGSAPATSTNLVIDAVGVNNFNKLAVALASQAENVVGNATPATTFTGSAAANNTDMVVIDCLQYRYLVFEISGTFVATTSFQQGRDAAFSTANTLTALTSVGTGTATSATAVGVWMAAVQERFVRFRTTAYTSGTVNITVFAFQQAPTAQALQAIQAGTWNIGTVTTVTTVSTLTSMTNWGNIVDNAAFTDGTTRVSMSGHIFDETAGTALTENDGGASRMDSKRAQILVIEDETTRGQRATVNASKGLAVTPVPHTAGGLSLYHLISAATTNANSVKASAGQLYGWSISNNSNSWRYVKLHNTAGTPTAGSGVVMAIGIPPGGGSNISLDHGVPFATGIGITIVADIADAGATAVGASEVNVNLYYK